MEEALTNIIEPLLDKKFSILSKKIDELEIKIEGKTKENEMLKKLGSDRLLTVSEAAALLGLSRRTIHNLGGAGKLEFKGTKGKFLIPAASIASYVGNR